MAETHAATDDTVSAIPSAPAGMPAPLSAVTKTVNPVQLAKTALRKSMKGKLKQLAGDDVARQSDAVTAKLLQHPWYTSARSISVYTSLPHSEIRTDAIIRDALSLSSPQSSARQAKQVYLPYTPLGVDAPMRMLRLNDLKEYESLKANRWQIREFEKTDVVGREAAMEEPHNEGLDLILMPGLAFDRHLNRLGHGKGYYDTYMHKAALWGQQNGHPRPRTIALALHEQLLPPDETIPVIDFEDGHPSGHRDIPPDLIMTPTADISLDAGTP